MPDMTWRPLLKTGLCTLGLLAASACGDSAGSSRKPTTHDDDPTPDAGSDASTSDDDAGTQGDGDDSPDASSDDPDAGTETEPWYAARTPIELAFSGPFGDAFEAAHAGRPDGIVHPVRIKDWFTGSITHTLRDGTSHTESLSYAVRGQSSLQECAFPKLKWKFDTRVDDANHSFVGTKKMKIATHCGEEEQANGVIGRLQNEIATYREELVYQLAQLVGITTLQTRPALITYHDTSSTQAFESPLTRKAFLLEHIDELARRLGATRVLAENCEETAAPGTDDPSVLRIKFFHAMVGNWDFNLGTRDDACTHNTELLVLPGGHVLLVPTDFDLAALVVGSVRNPESQQDEPIDETNAWLAASEALSKQLAGASESAVRAMTDAYYAKREALLAAVDASLADAEGKLNAKLLIHGFFEALAR